MFGPLCFLNLFTVYLVLGEHIYLVTTTEATIFKKKKNFHTSSLKNFFFSIFEKSQSPSSPIDAQDLSCVRQFSIDACQLGYLGVTLKMKGQSIQHLFLLFRLIKIALH